MPSGQKINSEIGVTQILALKTFVFRISDLGWMQSDASSCHGQSPACARQPSLISDLRPLVPLQPSLPLILNLFPKISNS